MLATESIVYLHLSLNLLIIQERNIIIPSNRTMRGKERLMALQALVIPLAIVAQLTIPPNTFTRIALTWMKKPNNMKVILQ